MFNIYIIEITIKINLLIFFMSSIFPSIFVPFIGLIFPFVTLGSFFKFVEKDEIK